MVQLALVPTPYGLPTNAPKSPFDPESQRKAPTEARPHFRRAPDAVTSRNPGANAAKDPFVFGDALPCEPSDPSIVARLPDLGIVLVGIFFSHHRR